MTKGHVLLYIQISWIMQITMGTSPTETLSVAGNIFIGQVPVWEYFPQIILYLSFRGRQMVNNGINKKININSTYCVGLHVLPVFLCCRLRLPCWFAHIWRTWPNLRFMPLWLEDLLQLQEVSWGHSSHLGWAQTVIAPHSINLCTGSYLLQKRCKFIYLYTNYKDFTCDYTTNMKRDNEMMCFIF